MNHRISKIIFVSDSYYQLESQDSKIRNGLLFYIRFFIGTLCDKAY